MHCFRVWPDGRVEESLPLQILDGEGRVPVGGTRQSYVHVDGVLTASCREDLRIKRAGIMPYGETGVMLTLENPKVNNWGAIVLVPSSSAFVFSALEGELRYACRHSHERVAELLLMQAGDMVKLTPPARTLSERVQSIIFSYDGTTVRSATE